MQVRNGTAAELTLEIDANIPVCPGFTAVASPVLSIDATVESNVPQVGGPTWLVISFALGAQGPEESCEPSVEHACAVNCCCSLLEVQPVTVSTTTELTLGCTVTTTGALVTPPALAVMFAVPEI